MATAAAAAAAAGASGGWPQCGTLGGPNRRRWPGRPRGWQEGAPSDKGGEDEEEGADEVEREQALVTQSGLRTRTAPHTMESLILGPNVRLEHAKTPRADIQLFVGGPSAVAKPALLAAPCWKQAADKPFLDVLHKHNVLLSVN